MYKLKNQTGKLILGFVIVKWTSIPASLLYLLDLKVDDSIELYIYTWMHIIFWARDRLE